MFKESFSDEQWKRLDLAIDWLSEIVVSQKGASHVKDVTLQQRKNLLSGYGANQQLLANVEGRKTYASSKPGFTLTHAMCKALFDGGKIPTDSEHLFAHWLITGRWATETDPSGDLSAAAIAQKIKQMNLSPEEKTRIVQVLME